MPTLTFDFSPDVFATVRRSPSEFAKEMRLAVAIRFYARGEISQGRAAEIAGVSRAEFIQTLAREKIDVFQVDFDDLQEEIDRA